MKKFIVHIKRHCGWHTTEAEGATFGEAAIKAVIATCRQFGLDVDTVPHTVAFKDGDYPAVVFTEASTRPVFGGTQYKGSLWFAERVREGEPDDCQSCGGTGIGHSNPFVQCWACGDRTARGEGTGKQAPATIT